MHVHVGLEYRVNLLVSTGGPTHVVVYVLFNKLDYI